MSDCQRQPLPPQFLLISNHASGKEVVKNDRILPEELREHVNTNKVKKTIKF